MQNCSDDNALYSELFENGIQISVIDHSRKIAGDRWLIKIKCLVQYSMPASSSSPLEGCLEFSEKGKGETEDKEIYSKIFWRERNFVEAKDRQRVLEDLQKQLKETIFPYLRREAVVEKLCSSRTLPHEKASSRGDLDNPFAHLDQDDAPADFSSLFGK